MEAWIVDLKSMTSSKCSSRQSSGDEISDGDDK